MYESIQEMRRLASLTGNIGRLITRFIQRHFKAVSGAYEMEVRACAKRVSSPLEFAVFVAYLQEPVKDQKAWIEYPGVTTSVLPWASSDEVSLIVRVDPLPASVHARQAVLLEVAMVMERYLQYYNWLSGSLMLQHQVISYLGDIYYRRYDESFRIFGDLLKGDFSDIGRCDRRLVCLAGVLNPDVASVVPKDFKLDLEGLGVDEVHELMEDHLEEA